MTSDRPERQAPDDEEIGRLVRDVASEWHQPPQRLGQPTWRDRVGRGAKGPSRLQRWLPRLAGTAAVALVATVAVALGAAWLNSGTGPSTGAAPTPTAATTSGPTPSGPTPSPQPKLVVYGEAPQATGVLVATGQGLARVDLRTGDLTHTAACTNIFEATYLPMPDGGALALCRAHAPSSAGDRVTVSLDLVSGGGNITEHVAVGSYVGSFDPAAAPSARAAPVVVDAAISPDGRWIYVGWAAQQGSQMWRMGVDVVRRPLGAAGGGSVVTQSFELPAQDSNDVTGGFTAPRVRVAPDGSHAVIWVHDFNFQDQGRRRHWSATMTADGQLSAPSSWAAAGGGTLDGADCRGGFTDGSDEGFATAATYFGVCGESSPVLRIVRLDGSLLGESSSFPGGFGGAALLDRAAGTYLVWDAIGSTISRVDLATLRVTSSAVAEAAFTSDQLAALGRRVSAWLVPTASAKVFLSPAMILSPDGTRLYLIGATAGTSTEASGSTGIWVVDPATLTVLGHWPATADFDSIAISADGSELYAAASATGPGPNAPPKTGNVPASVTVFDATTGAIKAIAGQLGSDALRFIADGGSVAE